MAERELPKLAARVRFPSPAPKLIGRRMIDKNYIIINREAKIFSNANCIENEIKFADEMGTAIHSILIDGTLYAGLFCDEVCNITFIVNNSTSQDVVTLLWHDSCEYEKFKSKLQDEYELELSKQNIKINRYAESIAEKLTNGVKLRVTDAADNRDMVECPECGMMNTKGSPYCMDCGADL